MWPPQPKQPSAAEIMQSENAAVRLPLAPCGNLILIVPTILHHARVAHLIAERIQKPWHAGAACLPPKANTDLSDTCGILREIV